MVKKVYNRIKSFITRIIIREYRRALFLATRFHFEIISLILLVIIIASLYLIIEKGYLTNEFAEKNKDLVDLLDKLLKLIILIFAGIISYLRFFKGRIFNSRLIIEITEKISEYSKEDNILVGDIKLINPGSFPISGIKISYAIFNLNNEYIKKPTDLISSKLKPYEEFVIESSEVAQFQFYEILKKETKFYRFEFEFRAKNNTWKRELIVENKEKKV